MKVDIIYYNIASLWQIICAHGHHTICTSYYILAAKLAQQIKLRELHIIKMSDLKFKR